MKKKYIDYRGYRCVEYSLHDWICCPNCFNILRKKNETGDYRHNHEEEIKESRQYYFIKEAKEAGFTKWQAVFMLDIL